MGFLLLPFTVFDSLGLASQAVAGQYRRFSVLFELIGETGEAESS